MKNMFAIIDLAGKQYRAEPNAKIRVDNLGSEVGEKIVLDKILCLKNDKGETLIGAPLITGAKVEAEVTKIFKDKKVLIFKKRRRKNSRRKRGHRQQKTELRILSIQA